MNERSEVTLDGIQKKVGNGEQLIFGRIFGRQIKD